MRSDSRLYSKHYFTDGLEYFPGALMVVAWIGFATMAIIVARYMKETWGELCGKKAWFQVSKQNCWLVLTA